MYQSIFYKEWKKTEKSICLIAVVLLGALIYSVMEINQAIRLSGAVALWEGFLQKDTDLLPYFKYPPLLGGILLAVAQYAPEMQNKRLKLTLHLPLSETKIVSYMLLYGVGVMILLLATIYAAALIILSTLFAGEIVWSVAMNTLPWFLAGLSSYLLSAWICLEPSWKQRVFNALPSVCALSFFFIQSKSGAYNGFIPLLALFIVISFTFSYYSTARFKEGVQ